VVRLSGEQSSDIPEPSTLEQENALAAYPNLLTCFYLLTNGRTGRDVSIELSVDKRGRPALDGTARCASVD
jgi:hypothetical protein